MPAVKPTHQWRLPPAPGTDSVTLSRELELPELAVQLLQRRGHTTSDDIRAFLNPSPARLRKPDSLPDIAKATERILAALNRRERVLIYGDYDVDGVTGTALLVTTLTRLGADVLYYLPHREAEGYGFSLTGLDFARAQGVKLIVTNDCGSSDCNALAAAADSAIDVIVTDHHELRGTNNEERLPPALAVVNPKRADSRYPFRELAGVGVAFKLAWSVLSALSRPREDLTALLDLVGLGTIADVVPLVDENRILARLGLSAIRRSARPGLQALLKVARVADRPLTGYDVGFMLGPRINAAGRVGHAELAARLLLTQDRADADRLAAELDGLNRSRQTIEERILTQATEAIEKEGQAENRTIVVAREGWHAGVTGIVAAKLVERFWRPCVVVAMKGEQGKGSGRSVTGFNLHAALQACSAHLLGFGGHRYAAGLTVARDRLPGFSSALAEYAAGFPEETFEPTLHVDALVDLEQIDDALMSALEQFEPFGPDNAVPLFAAHGLEVVGYPRKVGKDHLKLTLRSAGRTLEAIAWGRSAEIVNLAVGIPNHLDICFNCERRTFAGRTFTQLVLNDLRTAQGHDRFGRGIADSRQCR